MKLYKTACFFVLLFFIVYLSLDAEAAENHRGSAPRSAPHSQGGIQQRRGPVKQPQQGGTLQKRGGIENRSEMHPGDRGRQGDSRNRGGIGDHREGGNHERYDFRGRDYRHFSVHEREIWRHGTWWRGCHHGRCGPWYFVGGVYYYYPNVVYPFPLYPIYVSEVVFVEAAVVPLVQPPVVVERPVIVERAPLPIQPQPRLRYYCDSPKGYAPDVQDCDNNAWHRVPEPPPQAPPPPERPPDR